MNIKLISPRATLRPMDSGWKAHMSPPLSLLVIGALTPPEHRVSLEDENVGRLHLNDRPDLVGLTVKVDSLRRAIEIADHYRSRGVPVVMGGIHPTACPDDCLPHADSVVVGEAEELWPHVLEDVSAHRLRPIYRNAGPVDIAQTPLPRWDLVRDADYLFTNTLTIGRGCPWTCDFCYNSAPNIDARYRMKPIGHIRQEIEALGTRHVMFIDDNFIGDPARARRLLHTLRGMRLTWHTAVSSDIGRHDDLLDLMAESGCKSLFIGFETVRQSSLLACHKAQNQVARYDDTVRKIHDRGMMINASLVFGFDHDTPDVFPASLDWLVRNRIETMTAHILTPYPGTRLYRQLLADGRITDHNLDHYNTAHVVFRPVGMVATELAKGYRWMYDRFYSWENILRRWPVSAAQASAYLQFNLLYRKFGRATCWMGKVFGMRRLARLAKTLAYGRTHDPSSRTPALQTSSPCVLDRVGYCSGGL